MDLLPDKVVPLKYNAIGSVPIGKLTEYIIVRCVKMTCSEEVVKVEQAMKETKNIRMYKRYQVIFLKLTGKTIREIANTVKVSERTVDYYWVAYREKGLEGLVPKKPTGQPKKLTDDQEFELLDLIINNTPAGVGFPASYNWNAGIIREYVLREYNVKYSIRGMTMVLHRLGLSFTRPTYTLKKADPEKQEKFREDFEEIKKN